MTKATIAAAAVVAVPPRRVRQLRVQSPSPALELRPLWLQSLIIRIAMLLSLPPSFAVASICLLAVAAAASCLLLAAR
jgi:hypothetical protein